MAKENNQFGIDYAYPGICTLCHTEIAEFHGSHEVATGKYMARVTALKPNFRTRLVDLSDGTKMNISLCDVCDNTFEPEDCKPIMESEIKGWEKDSEHLKDEKIRADYNSKMSKLTITDVPSKKWDKDQVAKIGKPKGVK
jgi:hypothetical protein